MPWIHGTRLLVGKGDTGLTGNLYCGLHEFEDMAFLLHFLRDDSLFVDVGANAGSYSILAAGVVQCQVIAIEPVQATFDKLLDNVNLNRLHSRVTPLRVALSDGPVNLLFTTDLDTVNHVVASGESSETTELVTATTLDEVLNGRAASLIKIDVEGHEGKVLQGATHALKNGSIEALIVEANPNAANYGSDVLTTHSRLQSFGYSPHLYDPYHRELSPITLSGRLPANVLYLRSAERARRRVQSAPRFSVIGLDV